MIRFPASATDRFATSATRTVARDTASGSSSPGCSEFVVTTSSPGRRPRPATTRLQPSVVELVNASDSGAAEIRLATFCRTRVRSSSMLSNHARPPRPCSWS